ncbi:MAG TPA: hypothetical protein VHG28_10135 [Longimicrobiaceae bacterium]|nr:hypothetical protein [Longimicrobiaceae bacterium]
MDALRALWWERLPAYGNRFSRMLGVALGEGVYLVAWPRMAALAPAGALLLGVVAGWWRLGGPQVFTQSELVIAVAIGLGLVAAQLGVLFTVGYALGDLLLWRHPDFPVDGLMDRVRLLGGMLVVYAALAMLAAGIPLAVRALRAQTPLPPEDAPDARVALDALLGAVFSAGLTWLYVQALPMLIRPLFVWQGMVPSVESVAPAQQRTWIFVLLAAVVGGCRVLAEYGACVIDPGGIGRRAAALDAPEPSAWERLPATLRVPLAATAATCLLGGLLFTWLDAAILFAGLLAIDSARTLLPARIAAWPRTVERIPAVFRLPAALGLGYVVSSWIVSGRMGGQSFLPLIWGFLAGLLCMALFFPGGRAGHAGADRAAAEEAGT